MYEVEADSLRHDMFDEERRKDDGRRMNLRSLRTDNE